MGKGDLDDIEFTDGLDVFRRLPPGEYIGTDFDRWPKWMRDEYIGYENHKDFPFRFAIFHNAKIVSIFGGEKKTIKQKWGRKLVDLYKELYYNDINPSIAVFQSPWSTSEKYIPYLTVLGEYDNGRGPYEWWESKEFKQAIYEIVVFENHKGADPVTFMDELNAINVATMPTTLAQDSGTEPIVTMPFFETFLPIRDYAALEKRRNAPKVKKRKPNLLDQYFAAQVAKNKAKSNLPAETEPEIPKRRKTDLEEMMEIVARRQAREPTAKVPEVEMEEEDDIPDTPSNPRPKPKPRSRRVTPLPSPRRSRSSSPARVAAPVIVPASPVAIGAQTPESAEAADPIPYNPEPPGYHSFIIPFFEDPETLPSQTGRPLDTNPFPTDPIFPQLGKRIKDRIESVLQDGEIRLEAMVDNVLSGRLQENLRLRRLYRRAYMEGVKFPDPNRQKKPQQGGNRGRGKHKRTGLSERIKYGFNKGTLVRFMRRAGVKRANYKGGILNDTLNSIERWFKDVKEKMMTIAQYTRFNIFKLKDMLYAIRSAKNVNVYLNKDFDKEDSPLWVTKKFKWNVYADAEDWFPRSKSTYREPAATGHPNTR